MNMKRNHTTAPMISMASDSDFGIGVCSGEIMVRDAVLLSPIKAIRNLSAVNQFLGLSSKTVKSFHIDR